MSEANPFRAPEASLVSPAPLHKKQAPGRVDPGGVISIGWDQVKANLGTIFAGGFLAFILFALAVVSVVGIVFLVPVLMSGFYRFLLNIRDQEASISDLFSGFKNYFHANFGMLMVVLLTMGPGLVLSQMTPLLVSDNSQTYLLAFLAVLPFIAWLSIRLEFSLLLLVDQEMGPFAAMKESWRLSQGNFWAMFFFRVLYNIVSYLGLFALGVGLVFAVPTTLLASVALYRQAIRQPASSFCR